MVDAERKGQALMSQADKKCRTVGHLFGSLFAGGSTKTDEAAELYGKAANQFKIAKNWPAAGHAFVRAATVEWKAGEKHITASHYVDAANCYRKVDTAEAVKLLIKAIDIYVDMGRFSIAAKHHLTIAEIYEANAENISKAIGHYQQAADYYRGEESTSSANKCLQKVAYYSVELHQFERALEIYEKLASASMNTQLLRYGAKDHFFRAALVRMCLDVQDARRAVDRYVTMFPAFEDTREHKLVQKLIGACEEGSRESFTAAVREHESYTRFDNWYTQVLETIRGAIPGETTGGSAGGGQYSEYNLR